MPQSGIYSDVVIWKCCEIIREKLPDTKILLLGILPFGKHNPNFRNTINQETDQFISIFPNRCSYIQYIDIVYIFLDKDGKIIKDLMPDFLHPNIEGHMLMFDKLDDEIVKLMKNKKKDKKLCVTQK